MSKCITVNYSKFQDLLSQMFKSKIEDNFEIGIHWQKSYIICMKCQNLCNLDMSDLGDTSYPRPCTDVNADGVPKLQCYKDTYMTHCTKNWL